MPTAERPPTPPPARHKRIAPPDLSIDCPRCGQELFCDVELKVRPIDLVDTMTVNVEVTRHVHSCPPDGQPAPDTSWVKMVDIKDCA